MQQPSITADAKRFHEQMSDPQAQFALNAKLAEALSYGAAFRVEFPASSLDALNEVVANCEDTIAGLGFPTVTR